MERVVTLKIPDHAHPLVRRLFEIMAEQQIGVVAMAEKSGVNKNTLKDWRCRSVPSVANIDACLNVMGYRLTIEEVE